jgi:putative chitinase
MDGGVKLNLVIIGVRMITKEQLAQLTPKLPKQKLDLYYPYLLQLLPAAHIDTPLRLCHFLAQVLEESDQLRFTVEIWGPTPQQLKYEPPNHLASILGNTQPGDGHAFLGRGFLMCTGRSNYKTCGDFFGMNFITMPGLLAQPEHAWRSAIWYWSKHKLNDLADNDDIVGITKAINGGVNGLDQRKKYLEEAKALLMP